jgi:hypothetical protein
MSFSEDENILLIGIDDTDNPESRGTGYLARKLGVQLQEQGFMDMLNITRHQLLVDERISYTSHNSSACLMGKPHADKESITDLCSDFLVNESAAGSDAGLCIAKPSQISANILQWGIRAKNEILSCYEADNLAGEHNILLLGLTGEKTGVIGALAAAALRAGGNDGRVLWTKNLRELQGIFSIRELLLFLNIDLVVSVSGKQIHQEDKVFTGEWCRPVIKNQNITLFVEEAEDHEQFRWKCASKDFIKNISG